MKTLLTAIVLVLLLLSSCRTVDGLCDDIHWATGKVAQSVEPPVESSGY